MRTRTCVDSDWRFALGDHPEAARADFDDTGWRVLDLPHDWSIEATPDPANPAGASGAFFPGGVGWYRKRLAVPGDLGGRRVLIEFDGVYRNSEVWCNGCFCGRRPYGYSSFCYDLTPHLVAGGPNIVAVRVDNSRQPNARWYTGSGIYRHVWLTVAGPLRIAHWGTFVATPAVSAERALVECAVTVVNDPNAECGMRNAECGTMLSVECRILDAECRTVPTQHSTLNTQRFPPSHFPLPTQHSILNTPHSTLRLSLTIPNPVLWSPATPHLYTLRIELKQDGRVVDTYDTRFGVRSIRFDAGAGFFLNGQSLKLQGVNEHHDAGCLGAAVPDEVLRRRLGILKAMGCNAIRTAHNPASPALLELCDELGFLVVEDVFDEWRDGKTEFGYHLDWDEWWERDLVDLIRRDRNHPCIVLWSVGNEIKEVRTGRTEGLPIMKALRDVCHREDPTRPMTCGCCNSRETLAAGYGPLMDVFGYNGGGGGCFDYEKDHATYPGMPMLATEVPHTLQTRGVYRTRTWYRDLARNKDNLCWHESATGGGAQPAAAQDADAVKTPSFFAGVRNARPLDLMYVPHLADAELFTGFNDRYQSSYDNALVRISCRDSWRRTRSLPYVCGEFRWSGFDYLGECYGWPAKSWNFGIIDLAGFPKDAYYFYQSQWTTAPMVHVLPHWTWPGLEGRSIPVVVYTNCDRVELFLNDASLGCRERDDHALHLRWDVPYRPGTLRAVAYRRRPNAECGTIRMRNAERSECGMRKEEGERDEAVATCVHETAGAPAALRLACEEAAGIAHVTVEVVDAQGRFVPHASPDVTVSVAGPARLLGLENGDPLDTTNYKLNQRRAFHGRLLAIVQGRDAAVSVRAAGLPAVTVRMGK